MTKSLMILHNPNAVANGEEGPLFGSDGLTATETVAQFAATQACTFSKLGLNIISGGSGTNTCTFRKAGAAGNQVAAIAGTGAVEDASNTDVLAAADLFNLAFTDNGTSPVYAFVKANVEFTVGHGCFHGAGRLGGPVWDVPSATRFVGLNGSISTDAEATEANAAFKNRAYDTFAAMQVRILTNARTNDSVFKNRINGADGTGIITFGAGVSGLLQDTAIGDAIGDGQTVGMSITLGTGVEDLIPAFVGATLTSSTQKSECFIQIPPGLSRPASATAHYFTIGGYLDALTTLTEAQARIKPGFVGTASNLRIYLSTNTYTAGATLKLFVNGVAALTTTIGAGGGAAWYENTADSVAFDADDELSYEIVGGTSGSNIIRMIGVTLRDDASAGGFQFSRFDVFG